MASRWSCLFLLLLLPPLATSIFDPRRHLPRPWVYVIDEDTDDFRQTLAKPWIAVNHQELTQTLANTTGFRIASAALQQHPLTSLILVDEVYRYTNKTKLFIPNCNGIRIYLCPLENEMEILEHNPTIIDDMISSRRYVKAHLIKKVKGFDGGGNNVSVSRPFIYSNEEGVVVVHGVGDKGFGAMERQIINLSMYPPLRRIDDRGEGLVVDGAGGFQAFEYPPTKEEQDFINKLKMKIEMVVVADIVPTPVDIDYDHDSVKWMVLSEMYGGPEEAIAHVKEKNTPYTITMLYALLF